MNTCVMAGVTTCVCVSTTIREGVEYNYRMIIASDAVAEVHRDTHEAELKTMARIFADVKSSDEVITMQAHVSKPAIEAMSLPTGGLRSRWEQRPGYFLGEVWELGVADR